MPNSGLEWMSQGVSREHSLQAGSLQEGFTEGLELRLEDF